GAAAACPELRGLFTGWERADSIVVNPHKWFFTPIDCSALFTRRQEAVRAAFSLVPEYLRTAEDDSATNFMDYGVALGRRFRALKLWFVLRYFGREGVADRIRAHIELAGWLRDRLDETPGWERVAPVHFGILAFRWAPEGLGPEEQDRAGEAILDRVNGTGLAFLSHTRLRGRYCLRAAIGNLKTTHAHVERLWELLNEAAREVGGGPTG
ncbi:MAG TPA: pyridoxal-dependent decarboxylase, partial [Longimicrobiales bacterium]|nr:pyridoxal-dependent decarboxylase [Longimicrobiales bacterium]